jgi:hypothetical protein
MYYLTASASGKTSRKQYQATESGLRAARRFGLKKLTESNCGNVTIHGHGYSQSFMVSKVNEMPTLEELEYE